jgi:hypothetical protein
MISQLVKADPSLIAAEIAADPAAAYNRMTGPYWGAGLEKWVPEHMRAGMARYVVLGVLPGSFLRAVLSNDLIEAGRMADDENRRCLFEYVMFFINYAPSDCYGSPEAMRAWAKRGGILGRSAEEAQPC